MEERCEICKFYSEECSVAISYGEEENYTGGCRKNSPILIVNGCSGFPPVSKNSWYGEFKPKQEDKDNEDTNKTLYCVTSSDGFKVMDYGNTDTIGGIPYNDFSLKHNYGEDFSTITHLPTGLSMDISFSKRNPLEDAEIYLISFVKQLREKRHI